jgi:hypothetical protein
MEVLEQLKIFLLHKAHLVLIQHLAPLRLTAVVVVGLGITTAVMVWLAALVVVVPIAELAQPEIHHQHLHRKAIQAVMVLEQLALVQLHQVVVVVALGLMEVQVLEQMVALVEMELHQQLVAAA